MRCEGYRRNGGMMTLGPVRWEQCRNTATVNITVEQDGETKTFPACKTCWKEAIEADKIKILEVVPIEEIANEKDLLG